MKDDNDKYFDGFLWNSTAEFWAIVPTTPSWNINFPIGAWKNGIFTMRVRARDGANNVVYHSITFTISGSSGTGVADAQPPFTFIHNPVPNSVQSPFASTYLGGDSNDPFGVDEVVVSLKQNQSGLYWNGASFNSSSEQRLNPTILFSDPYFKDWEIFIPASAYSDGVYIFKAYAKDPSNNQGVVTSTFTISGAGAGGGDVTLPSAEITSVAEGATVNASQLLTISGTASDNNQLFQTTLKIRRTADGFYWDGAEWVQTEFWMLANGLTNWLMKTSLGVWSAGNYDITIKAEDLAQNIFTKTNTITVSGTGSPGTPPTSTMEFPADGITYTPANLATISGTVADDGTVTLVQLRITDQTIDHDWDPAAQIWVKEDFWITATLVGGNWSSTAVPFWPPGQFRIAVRATDDLGLFSTPDFHKIDVSNGGSDFTAPGVIHDLDAQTGNNPGQVDLTWTAPGDDGTTGTATTFSVKYSSIPIDNEQKWQNGQSILLPPVNQNAPSPGSNGTPHAMTISNLNPGSPYFWAIRAYDEAGNRSPISNSPFASAKDQCSVGIGDGQGTATFAPATVTESTVTVSTLTVTIGASGLTNGGKVQFRVPDLWIMPQTMSPSAGGYVSFSLSNTGATGVLAINGPMVIMTINSGSLNAGDTVRFFYHAFPSCGVRTGIPIDVLTQASACGFPQPIGSQPTVDVTAGAISWLEFDRFQKLVQIATIESFKIQGKNACGTVSNLASNLTVAASVVNWDPVNSLWTTDPHALLSENSDLSSSFTSNNVTINSGSSEKTLYYRLTSSQNQGNNYVRIVYTDINGGSFNSENILEIIPFAGSSALTNLSIDNGQVGTATTATLDPGTAGLDRVFFNFSLSDPNLGWQVEVSQDNFATIPWQTFGFGSPARLVWDGRQNDGFSIAPPGAYKVRVTAGGIADSTTLTLTLQSNEVTGTVLVKGSTTPIQNAFVDIFGPNAAPRHTQTNSSGTFSIVGIPAGTYQLHIFKPGYAPYENSEPISNGANPLPNIELTPESTLTLDVERTETSPELWGTVRLLGGGVEIPFYFRLADGEQTADDGAGNTPQFLVTAGVSYDMTLEIPGYDNVTLTRTFGEGENFTWDISLVSKSKISGQIQLSNNIATQNQNIIAYMNAGLDDNNDGQYDLGYPSFFVDTIIPAFERTASYEFPGVDNGDYLVEVFAEGFTPQTAQVTVAGSNTTQNFTLDESGQLTLTIALTGDSTTIPINTTGLFEVILRFQDLTGASLSKTFELAPNASSTQLIQVMKGVPDGTYSIFHQPIPGFKPNFTGIPTATVTNSSGSVTLSFTQNSGQLVGTLGLASGSTMGDVEIKLTKDNVVLSSPTLSGNQFTFANLETGSYLLSIIDTRTNGSFIQTVLVTDGQATNLGTINLATIQVHSLSGTFRTTAAPPFHTLASIDSNSQRTTMYTANGSSTVAPLRVEAYLLNIANPVFTLPTSTSQPILDTTLVKIAEVNLTDGSYTLPGLEEGKSYRVLFVSDTDGDGVSNFPIQEQIYSLTADRTGVDFTVKDGADITGTLTAPTSDDGHALSVKLTDINLKKDFTPLSVSLSGTSASFSFEDLRVGQYLIQIIDSETPAKYGAKPQVVTLESATENKSVDFILTRSAVVRGKLATAQGTLITSDNATFLLPEGFQIELISKGHRTTASGPTSDGTYSATIIPDTDYTLVIRPPIDATEGEAGKGFLPIEQKINVDAGQYHDWGTIALQQGIDVRGSVSGTSNNTTQALAGIPVLAFQSLSPSINPIRVLTDEAGEFTFEDLDSRIRFYDFKINPVGNTESNPTFTEVRRTMIDITKTADITGLDFTLTEVQGGITGDVDPASGDLLAAFGDHHGSVGVSIIIQNRAKNEVLEFISSPDGTFTVPLPKGLYDIYFLAQGHKRHLIENQLITTATENLGTIPLATGVTLSGTIRNADGSLPTNEEVSNFFAFDSNNNAFRGHLFKETITQSVDRYVFSGLTPGAHNIVAVDQIGRLRVITSNLDVPNQDTTLNLSFALSEPQLTASFIQKLPDGVEIKFGCNQSFRNDPADLDSDGVADDDEFGNFISITQGAGNIVFDSVSADRKNADYTYTRGNETGQVLEVAATFNTEEIDPDTGNNFSVTGNFTHHFGLESQQEDVITTLGGQFVLPGGSGFTLPSGWSGDANLTGTLIRFQAADTAGQFTGTSAASGAGAMALAKQLGPAAYPAHMYRAITAMAAAPDINPLSSFYDIFLPATVSRVFTNNPTLTLKYDDGADPTKINIYYFNEAQGIYTIENTDRRVDTVNRTISVSIGHASIFTVVASSAPIIRGDAYSGDLAAFNFPNPFDLNTKTVNLQNPGTGAASRSIDGTMIKVSVPAAMSGTIGIDIFTVAGTKVRTLTTSSTGGEHVYIGWDGKNQSGKKVASGVYIGRLTVNNGSEKFFKMAVIK